MTHRLFLLALTILGAWLCWNAGHKGLFLLDQSMVFDSAWRILQGQVPYRDFGMPFGPLTSFIQALSFQLLGINWHAMVAPAALLHALSVPLTWFIQRKLFPQHPGLPSWSAALFAALSFYSPIGTLWFEITGVFLFLVALYLVAAGPENGPRRHAYDFAAGVTLFLIFLSKQNIALFYAPCLLAWLCLRPMSNRRLLLPLLTFSSGAASALLVATFAALSVGALPSAWYYLIEIPRQIAAARASAEGLPLGYPKQLNYILFPQIAILLFWAALETYRGSWRDSPWRVFVFCLLEFVAWTLTVLSTANELVIYAFGAGRLLSNSFGLIQDSARRHSPKLRLLNYVYATLSTTLLSVFVLYNVQTRFAMQFYQPARFSQSLRSPGLESLRWGDPTPLTDLVSQKEIHFPAEDFQATLAFLRAQNQPFFVWGDSTLFYGLAAQPSSSPLLYLGANHSYMRGRTQEMDQRLLASLAKSQIAFVVRETALYVPKGVNDLRDFPLTLAWIESNFKPAQSFGIYQILARSR